MTTTSIEVNGMSCSHCKAAVEKAVKSLPGVSRAEVDLAEKKVNLEVDTDKTSLEQVRESIREAGYEPVS